MPKPKNKTPHALGKKEKKTHISIKAFPDLNKIIIYQVKDGNAEKLKSLEGDLRSYFSANKEKYSVEKSTPNKEKP